MFDGANLFYVHPDHLDRPVMMTNATAQTIAWAAKYDPFGNPVTVTVSPVNNQRLPGQWFQSEDGLAYNWHRTYDPSLGRYNQADPLGFVDGPSVYGYAGQSPVMGVDPWGLSPISYLPRPPLPKTPICYPEDLPEPEPEPEPEPIGWRKCLDVLRVVCGLATGEAEELPEIKRPEPPKIEIVGDGKKKKEK